MRKNNIQNKTEYYLFTINSNMQAYIYDNLLYTYYGYDNANSRKYKISYQNSPTWINGQPQPTELHLRNIMFYPNSYLNFNQDGYYTKHYYNGMERIASRLGDQNLPIATHAPDLQDRKDQLDSNIRRNIVGITGYEFLPVGEEQDPENPKPVFELPVIGISNLQPSADGIFYYHPNHLGSTCYVTDGNASVVQGFLYAPFGEITNEYNNSFGSSVLPKYSFNAKELDEETGMYYYEARYMAPPVFTSRDPLLEKYPTTSPYTYCANNPVNVIDPTGKEAWKPDEDGNLIAEKGDNAWTLARYLNTSTEIAKKMLAEQGYTVNDKEVLNLKDGDVFKVDYGNKTKCSDNLGLIGNSIRDFASKGIAQDVFSYFWQEKGDVKLTGSQFAGILLFIKNNENAVTDKGKVSLRGRSGKIYIGHRKEINFYGTNNYSLAFGRATVYTNSSGNIVGFYDVYNFNPQKLGARSIKNEIKTRLVNSASNLSGINSSIHINYGYSKWNP
ncbi:MAG: RHS repeat-associated core domain-containing protein [Bacteroidales bacterium]|nr:RHS repeat-associated core domain-containing protein [Bacteroidales bacterium]